MPKQSEPSERLTMKDSLEKRIAEMIALGEASRKFDKPLEPITPIRMRGGPVSKTISEDRKDRI